MKVFIHYEDVENVDWHKSLKITLPKSWKKGPVSRILQQFVESYNAWNDDHQLEQDQLHLAMAVEENNGNTTMNINNNGSSSPMERKFEAMASDCVVMEVWEDRQDVYVCHGPSRTLQDIEDEKEEATRKEKEYLASTVKCVHLGCQNRFPPEGPYPTCSYHISPPVFHETAKFWSCCPDKKAYDWDTFSSIPGCTTGTCTHIKDEEQEKQQQFLGGCDLRQQQTSDEPKLKRIEDFNNSSNPLNTWDQFENLMMDKFQIEKELLQQVWNGFQKQAGIDNDDPQQAAENNQEKLQMAVELLGKSMKSSLKNIAAQQLRIN